MCLRVFAPTGLAIVMSFAQSYAGTVTTIAGGGNDDGKVATEANFVGVTAVAVDQSRNIFLADGNFRVRSVDAVTGIVSTVAGNGGRGYSGDEGQATDASIGFVRGLFIDDDGDLYIAASSRVRHVDAETEIITTIAGNGETNCGACNTPDRIGDGGLAIEASISAPSGIWVDEAGHVFITDATDDRVRKIDAETGIITSVAGVGGWSDRHIVEENQVATEAQLYYPNDIVGDSEGNLYVAVTFQNRIRRIDAASGTITTVAGGGGEGDFGLGEGFSGDGNPATEAQLYHPGESLWIRRVTFSLLMAIIKESGALTPPQVSLPPSLETVNLAPQATADWQVSHHYSNQWKLTSMLRESVHR